MMSREETRKLALEEVRRVIPEFDKDCACHGCLTNFINEPIAERWNTPYKILPCDWEEDKKAAETETETEEPDALS